MTKEKIKNYVIEHKECCKKLAEEYRQRYNEDNTNKLALNMFYHNVIAYNNFETILATIEDRNSMIMCFSEPPILSEKTVEVELNRIADLEKENAELNEKLSEQKQYTAFKCNEFVKKKEIYEREHFLFTIAKEFLEKCVCIINRLTPTTALLDKNERGLLKQAEQFLSEVEK